MIRKTPDSLRGIARVAALSEAFFQHLARRVYPGGCFFATVAAQLAPHPGRARDRVMKLQGEWVEQFIVALGRARYDGELQPDADLKQLVFEISAMMFRANSVSIVTRGRGCPSPGPDRNSKHIEPRHPARSRRVGGPGIRENTEPDVDGDRKQAARPGKCRGGLIWQQACVHLCGLRRWGLWSLSSPTLQGGARSAIRQWILKSGSSAGADERVEQAPCLCRVRSGLADAQEDPRPRWAAFLAARDDDGTDKSEATPLSACRLLPSVDVTAAAVADCCPNWHYPSVPAQKKRLSLKEGSHVAHRCVLQSDRRILGMG